MKDLYRVVPATLFNHDKKLLFGYTPKCGCVTVAKLFFNEVGHLEQAMNYHNWVHKYRMEVYDKAERAVFRNFFEYHTLKIKFVRNPYHRAVSCFLHILRHSHLEKNSPVCIDADLEKFGFNGDATFEEYLDLLEGDSTIKREVHTRPQFLSYEKVYKFDEYVQIENFEERLKEINNKYGMTFSLSPEMTHSNHHRVKDPNQKEYVYDRKYLTLNKNEIVPEYKFFYTPEIAERVYKLYENDFLEYGYAKDSYVH